MSTNPVIIFASKESVNESDRFQLTLLAFISYTATIFMHEKLTKC